MSQAVPTISYASPQSGECELCHQRPAWKKPLYGYPVCKKCYYRFVNRRQLAFIVDSLLWLAVASPIGFLIGMQLERWVTTDLAMELAIAPVALLLNCVFIMKDGFNGQSPGKWLTDVQVLDGATGRPISFGASFKRNAVLLVGAIPIVGGLASLVILITIAIQMSKGYRIGDRFANTRVIWKRYARSSVFGGDGLLCHSCGYDLTGNESGICPECGTRAPGAEVMPAGAFARGR